MSRPAKARARAPVRYLAWFRYFVGRLFQVTGLMITLVAGTAFFGTPDILAMLKMMLIGVGFFLPGWWLARKDPQRG